MMWAAQPARCAGGRSRVRCGDPEQSSWPINRGGLRTARNCVANSRRSSVAAPYQEQRPTPGTRQSYVRSMTNRAEAAQRQYCAFTGDDAKAGALKTNDTHGGASRHSH